nr:integrase, catalytic region, zinc finger, CCHC-type, peptidase aspartic, catalytic [Tanacetum cinerariifolium]
MLRAPKEHLSSVRNDLRQHKEESINDYYVRFSKLINDMRNIKMTMPKLQLNSKFVNNILPEWAQPTADPLALLLNVSNTQHGSPSSSTSSITPLPPPRANSTDDLIKNLTSTLALLTQSYRTFLPQTNNQLRTSSNPRNQAIVQDGRVVVQNIQGRPNRADPITDEAGPSYDSDILSKVQDHYQYLDDTCAYQEEHVMHNSVQLDHVVDLHADYTSVGNMIPYDQYVKDNENKVAIGYKNPLCLTRAKQAQPALYNGHEILKDNHARAKVHNTEDTLEIAMITRKKMNAKMTDPECVTHKVKIAPHDYSKENLLATFTPQKQLTPE